MTSVKRSIWAVLLSPLFLFTAVAGDWTQTDIEEIKDWVDEAQLNMTNIQKNMGNLEELQDMVGRVQENLDLLNSRENAKEFIQNGIDQVQLTLAKQNEGLDEFVGNNCENGSPCLEFKANLKDLLTNFQALAESLHSLPENPTPTSVDLSNFSRMLDASPGKAIYPLYRAMMSGNNLLELDLNSFFTTAIEAVEVLKQGTALNHSLSPMEEETDCGAEHAFLEWCYQPPSYCPLILDDDKIGIKRFSNGTNAATGASLLARLFGGVLKAAGGVEYGYKVGTHGYANQAFSNNRKMKAGIYLSGIGEALGILSTHAVNNFRYCTIIDSERQMMEFIIANPFPGKGVNQHGK